jgi:Aldo/keto reductase family
MDPIEGRATAEGTARYRQRMAERTAPGHFRLLGGSDSPWLSSIGLGTGPGAADAATDAQYETAVARALGLGVNVFDTAVTYRYQHSERALGRALGTAIDDGRVRRDEVVIATKGGYIPFEGAPPPDPKRLIEGLYVQTGLVRREEVVAGQHCLAPRFLADQIAPSSSRRAESRPGRTATDRWVVFYPGPRRPRSRSRRSGRRARAGSQVIEPGVPAQSRSLGVTGSRRQ